VRLEVSQARSGKGKTPTTCTAAIISARLRV